MNKDSVFLLVRDALSGHIIGSTIDRRSSKFLGDKYSMPRKVSSGEYINDFEKRYSEVDINSFPQLYEFIKHNESQMSAFAEGSTAKDILHPVYSKNNRLKRLYPKLEHRNAKKFREIFEREFGEYMEIEA